MNDPSARRLALGLGLAFAIFAAVFPLLPEGLRLSNFALFGALGLFTAARVGFWPGVGLLFGSKLAFDLLNWLFHGGNPDYLPFPSVYATYLIYTLAGWALLRRTESPLRIGATAFGASMVFFVVSNFVSWLQQVVPYGYSLQGLADCYLAAIPFYRGTLLGDMLFTGVLYGSYAVLVRSNAAHPATEKVRA